MYIDGKLVKSIITTNAIKPNKIDDITIGTMDAKLIGFQRWSYALNPDMVYDEYNKSNMKKLLGNYRVDLSVLNNDVIAKRFSVF